MTATLPVATELFASHTDRIPVAILGATGSIGRRTLELVDRFPQDFRVEGLAARGSDPERLAEICRHHRPRALALTDPTAVDAVARALAAEGATVSMASRDGTAIRRAADTVARDTGGRALAVGADLGGAGLRLLFFDRDGVALPEHGLQALS